MPVSGFKRPLVSRQYQLNTLVFPDMPAGNNDLPSKTVSLRTAAELSGNELALKVWQYAKADALLISYDLYGYLGDSGKEYFRGPSMQALTRIIFGIKPAGGKLPVNIADPLDVNKIIYARDSGLTT
jgi:hypothetical protein